MVVWRICKARHVASAFSGIGAEKVGGRWNHKGERMVYTSSSLSLAALELFVHVELGGLPNDLQRFSASLPDTVPAEELTVKDLPKNCASIRRRCGCVKSARGGCAGSDRWFSSFPRR